MSLKKILRVEFIEECVHPRELLHSEVVFLIAGCKFFETFRKWTFAFDETSE